MLTGTKKNAWRLLRAANGSDSVFAARVPTTTQPTGAGVIVMPGAAQESEGLSLLDLLFFGTPGSASTFGFKIIGWSPTDYLFNKATSDSVPLWIPQELCAGTATIGTLAGSSSFSVPSSSSFTTGLTITNGNVNVDCKVHSPADNMPGSLMVDAEGAQLVEVLMMSADSATFNALWRAL
jgi:hypothetical protein